jgi:hypothetical protein
VTDLRPEAGELGALDEAIDALEGQRAVLDDHVVDTALVSLAEKRDRLLAASVGQQRKLGRVLADVHRVLTAAGDPRADGVAHRADGVAHRAASYLRQQPAPIRDSGLRARFLAAPVNGELARVAVSTVA